MWLRSNHDAQDNRAICPHVLLHDMRYVQVRTSGCDSKVLILARMYARYSVCAPLSSTARWTHVLSILMDCCAVPCEARQSEKACLA